MTVMSPNNFPIFAKLVAERTQFIAKHDPFEVNIPKVEIFRNSKTERVTSLFPAYLKAFPEGTDPLFKKSTEHDCSCCLSFFGRAGAMVCVEGGVLKTIWDTAVTQAPYPYADVAKVLQKMVQDAYIDDLFRTNEKESEFGKDTTRSEDENGKVLSWNHFFTGRLPSAVVVKKPDEEKGARRTTVQVFERGLKEILPVAVETVLSLIENNSLYKGDEFKKAVVEFEKAQKHYLSLKEERAKNVFVWANSLGPASRIRNTAIGTLLQNLSPSVRRTELGVVINDSRGNPIIDPPKDLEEAVRIFESVVAPQNYKRPTSLVTQKMLDQAMETIVELDLEPALQRRFAKLEDISVNDVKWADRGVKPMMKGGLAGVLSQAVAANSKEEAKVDESRLEEIGIEDLLSRILPETTGMEVLVKNGHLGNFMSLTAPVHPEPKQLFKWEGNDFCFSYSGNVTDSIKERVKKAGGNVNAKLRVSLSWSNHDDLDLHAFEPTPRDPKVLSPRDSAGHINFRNKKSPSGGWLDVDMNAGRGQTREPVENIAWNVVRDGVYKIVVNNFALREREDVGFEVEIENNGQVLNFSYPKMVANSADIHVVTMQMKNGIIDSMEVGEGLISKASSKEKWGIQTEKFVKVNAVTLSPNYWGNNEVGSKHTFFLLDGCKSDEPTRGIFNEFLHPRLEKHRKVFELIGEKTKCQPTEGQLSGLGFGSTRRDSLIVKVTQGKKQRLFNVRFGNADPAL